MKIIFNIITRHLEVSLFDEDTDVTTIEEHFFDELDEWYFPTATKNNIGIHFHYEDQAQLLVYERTIDDDLQLLESWHSPEKGVDGGLGNLKIISSDEERYNLEEWLNNHNIFIREPESLSKKGINFIGLGSEITKYVGDKYISEYRPIFNNFDFYIWNENVESLNDLFINLKGYEEFIAISKEQAIKLGWDEVEK